MTEWIGKLVIWGLFIVPWSAALLILLGLPTIQRILQFLKRKV